MEDEQAFRDFVAARLARLSGTAYLLTCDHHAAQDLVQSALVRLARHWSRVSRTGTPDAYVRKIIYHEFVSSRRLSRSRELPIGDPIERVAPGDETNDAIRRLVLRQALARLTAGQRAVIVLRYFDDLTEAETAEALGCSIGTVKSQTHHALGRLRTLAPELADLIREPMEVSP